MTVEIEQVPEHWRYLGRRETQSGRLGALWRTTDGEELLFNAKRSPKVRNWMGGKPLAARRAVIPRYQSPRLRGPGAVASRIARARGRSTERKGASSLWLRPTSTGSS
jgi:hypothetical protein